MGKSNPTWVPPGQKGIKRKAAPATKQPLKIAKISKPQFSPSKVLPLHPRGLARRLIDELEETDDEPQPVVAPKLLALEPRVAESADSSSSANSDDFGQDFHFHGTGPALSCLSLRSLPTTGSFQRFLSTSLSSTLLMMIFLISLPVKSPKLPSIQPDQPQS